MSVGELIKQLIIKKLERQDQKNRPKVEFKNLKNIKSILIVFDLRENPKLEQEKKSIIQEFKKLNKKVDIIAITNSNVQTNFPSVKIKDFFLFKRVELIEIQDIIQKQYDLLIVFSENIDIPLLKTIVSLKAKFRVFPKFDYKNFADLIILTKENSNLQFAKQVINYLNTIKN